MNHEEWRAARWEEIAGPDGKATVVAKGTVTGDAPQTLPGIPGIWRITAAGTLTVTADDLTVNGTPASGATEVPNGGRLGFPGGLVAFAGGTGDSFGVVLMDPDALTRSGLTGIDAYPYNPAWVFEGEIRAAPPDRRVEVGQLTIPRTTTAVLAPADLAVTINGTEHVLTVIETIPGQRLVIFTDETNGTETPDIGRWLNLPLVEPGTRLTVDLNQVTLSHHLLAPSVFTCPLAPPGNHLPMRVEAGERALIHEGPPVDLKDKAATYLRHLENREWPQARAMCADDATVWHNDGKGDSTIEENIAGMEGQVAAIRSMRYDITRQFAQPSEVLQQHVVNVVLADGAEVRLDAAVYFRFEDGLISRIEEYACLPSAG